ncbi:Coenzyme F420 hydrogenase/dehydrogenase, beta subunit C-terminal domain [Halorhabdus rudnickae]|uniref:Coenzyme F420 hydrogenase/dehydrogenase, beta subunit C-terminal domain n=1 Tax=Halorhabdus rudnickae TaxID=1775544 RepID=UPI0010840F43|nr:Coenzyme F420 hydrogenase/dehydrogenase, beta subunit C-terminal domain [Halorhabdus rudnickae]
MSGTNPSIPSVGSDPREQPGEVAEPPGKIWFRTLDEAVIEADRCIQCGSCVAACPSDSIGIDEAENRPTLVKMCTGCSSCWDYCPRSGLRYERVVESAQEERGLDEPETVAARARSGDARDAGQDGGGVTALLATLIEAGEIDGAVVASEDPEEPLGGVARLATTREELLNSAGSIYSQVMSLGELDGLIAESDLEDPSLALVGTPCVIQGASALDRYDRDVVEAIDLTVALMCTRNFEAERLAGRIAEHGVDPAAVDRLDVTEGVLYAYGDDGETLLEESIDSFDSAGLRGCDECADFLGGAADLSVGNVASPDGRTTLVVRTERGQAALEDASEGLDVEALEDTTALEKLANWNQRRAESILPREYDPEGAIGISHAEHREAYDDTDRAPEPLNPARVHQYEDWC